MKKLYIIRFLFVGYANTIVCSDKAAALAALFVQVKEAHENFRSKIEVDRIKVLAREGKYTEKDLRADGTRVVDAEIDLLCAVLEEEVPANKTVQETEAIHRKLKDRPSTPRSRNILDARTAEWAATIAAVAQANTVLGEFDKKLF